MFAPLYLIIVHYDPSVCVGVAGCVYIWLQCCPGNNIHDGASPIGVPYGFLTLGCLPFAKCLCKHEVFAMSMVQL